MPTSSPRVATRRHFLRSSALAAAALGASSTRTLSQDSPARRVRIGVMGLRRGQAHLSGFLAHPGAEISWVCDVDQRAVDAAAESVEKRQGIRPKTTTDFRRILDDRETDALSIAAPNHWHAPATILACAAGKHVYVEKPGSHNAKESELMVAAARKYQRHVQMGNQRRSWPFIQEAIVELHGGVIGKLHLARAWYNSARPSIGRGKPSPVPDWLNYDLWQGPAPERPYIDNLVHYNWHWRWHWGGGELANNGIHGLDLVRWGLAVEKPIRVSSAGGRYYFTDDQETPDTLITTFDFKNCTAIWEGNSCQPRGLEGSDFGIIFYGEGGSLTLLDKGWKVLDSKNQLIKEQAGQGDDTSHFGNFLSAIRDEGKLNSEIAEGQKSTLWCHLGNIAWRTGQTLNLASNAPDLLQKPDFASLWRREYRPEWEPKV